jgi:hypothetical protein
MFCLNKENIEEMYKISRVSLVEEIENYAEDFGNMTSSRHVARCVQAYAMWSAWPLE